MRLTWQYSVKAKKYFKKDTYIPYVLYWGVSFYYVIVRLMYVNSVNVGTRYYFYVIILDIGTIWVVKNENNSMVSLYSTRLYFVITVYQWYNNNRFSRSLLSFCYTTYRHLFKFLNRYTSYMILEDIPYRCTSPVKVTFKEYILLFKYLHTRTFIMVGSRFFKNTRSRFRNNGLKLS